MDERIFGRDQKGGTGWESVLLAFKPPRKEQVSDFTSDAIRQSLSGYE